MSDDYRNKYLALEKQFNILEQIQEYEVQKTKQNAQKMEESLYERITFEKEESDRRFK